MKLYRDGLLNHSGLPVWPFRTHLWIDARYLVRFHGRPLAFITVREQTVVGQWINNLLLRQRASRMWTWFRCVVSFHRMDHTGFHTLC